MQETKNTTKQQQQQQKPNYYYNGSYVKEINKCLH